MGSTISGSSRGLAPALALLALLAGCAEPPPRPPPEVSGEVVTLRLAMDPLDADVLFRKDPDDRSSFAVNVGLDEAAPPVPGRIEVKGGFTREFQKKAVLIKLAGDGHWHGQSRIVLNSEDTDPSLMREVLAYDLLHALHAVAPETQYTRLYINGEPRGLFVRVGWIGPKLLEKAGFGADGDMYEPRADNFCGDLSPASVEDTSHCYYNRTPGGGSFQPLRKLVAAIAAAPAQSFDRFVDGAFDADSVVNWIVMNAVTSNSDTYNKNYFLYRSKAKGKWVVVPFDFDLTFGRTFDPYRPFPDNVLNRNFTYYYPLQLGAPNLLRDKVLGNPEMMRRIRARLDELLNGTADAAHPWGGWASPEQMARRIAHLREVVKPAAADDPFVLDKGAAFEEEAGSLLHYAHARAGYLRRVILGDNDWARDTGEASLASTTKTLDVVDGFGYLLATLEVQEPGRIGRIAGEVRRMRPELVPDGVDRDTCVQRTWLLTAKDAQAPVVTAATVEYLQENLRSHELGPRVGDERSLALYARVNGRWQALPTQVNAIANSLATPALQLPPDEPVWLVACAQRAPPARAGR